MSTPPPHPSSFFAYQVEYLAFGRRLQNVFHFVYIKNDVWTTVQLLANISLELNGRLAMHRSVQVMNIGSVYIEYFPRFGLTIPVPQFMPGLIAEAAGPKENYAVMKMMTGVRGRPNRGRKFLPGMPASYWDGFYLTQEARRNISITWHDLEVMFHPETTDYPLTWGVLHRYVGGVKRFPFPFNWMPYTNLSLNARRMRHRHTKAMRFGFPFLT